MESDAPGSCSAVGGDGCGRERALILAWKNYMVSYGWVTIVPTVRCLMNEKKKFYSNAVPIIIANSRASFPAS